MKSIFIITFINIFASSLLNAEVAESYKCKLKEGVSRDQIISLGESYIAVGKKDNMDFKLSILFPMYSSDISNGVFYWNGTSSSLASIILYLMLNPRLSVIFQSIPAFKPKSLLEDCSPSRP